jgi:hypothetical protein
MCLAVWEQLNNTYKTFYDDPSRCIKQVHTLQKCYKGDGMKQYMF